MLINGTLTKTTAAESPDFMDPCGPTLPGGRDPDMPMHHGEPILDAGSRPAFRVAAQDILESIRQQFADRRLAFRELGQNSVDAGAERIRLDLRHDEESMVAEFRDDGCGMSLEVLEANYLTLFDSSKEQQDGAIGYYSLGRISAFVYPLEAFDLFTLSPGSPGYRLEIRPDYSGRLYEVPAEEMAEFLGSKHGTLVRLRFPVGDMAGFVAEAEAINASLRRELAWVKPNIQVTAWKIVDNALSSKLETINEPLGVPGRHGHTVEVRLASGLGTAVVALGVEGEPTFDGDGGSGRLETGLSHATLCIGRIPVQSGGELPWTGTEPFAIQNLRVIMDSFQFKTNIGRNRVYLDQPFARELLAKVFQHVILGRYIPALARSYSGHGLAMGNKALLCLLADVCVQSERMGFALPEELLRTPMIPALYRRRGYSIADLDAHPELPIYYSNSRQDIHERYFIPDPEAPTTPEVFCLCLADLPSTFDRWLERRYETRFLPKTHDILAAEEHTRDARRITEKVRAALEETHFARPVRSWHRLLLGNSCPVRITCGRIQRFDHGPAKQVPGHVFPNPDRVVFNLDNLHIQMLIDMLDSKNRDLAAHFLFREALAAAGGKLSPVMREQLLTRDLTRRFGAGPEQSGHQASPRAILDALESEMVLH